MRVKPLDIRICKDGAMLVHVRSSVGEAVGVWHGKLPVLGSDCDVEIDIPDALFWGKDVRGVHSQSTSISVSGDVVRIVGTLIAINHPSCLVIRVAESLLMLEVENIPLGSPGSKIELITNRLAFYPTFI